MALQRAGIEAIVYEAYDRPADYAGSFLNTASNGLDALRTLGVHSRVVAQGFSTPRMVMWSGTGKRLGEVANGVTLADGTTSITIRRGLLHRALRDEALSRGIRIEEGKRLVDAAEDARGVVAAFDEGTEVTGDFLIGSDGLHSRLRQIIDPKAPRPRYTGLLSMGGCARGSTLMPTPGTFNMIFGKRAFFGYCARSSAETWWFANLAWRKELTRQELSTISPLMWKEQLLGLFADDTGPATEILGATGDELAAYPIYDMPTVPTWHRGRIVLIGDAAHATSPSSGQGASLAIEDAVVLAKCLRDLPQPTEAFAAYVRLRRKRVEKVVQYSARISRSKTAGPISRWFRDLIMPVALKHFASPAAHAWLYQYHVDWNEPVHESVGVSG
jgi:2-polyprenyl-6-methoxyphenol hydroxylase-like FAD-dependent oxidoreductase